MTALLALHTYAGYQETPLRYGVITAAPLPDADLAGKRVLVFLPGLGGTIKSVLGFLESLLATDEPGYDVILGMDLRGFGLNHSEEPLISVDPMRQDIRLFFQSGRLAQAQSITLCGISLGGTLATELALDHPEWMRRLILLAPAFRAHPASFSWQYRLKQTVGKLVLGKRHRLSLPYNLTHLTRNPKVLNDPQYQNAPAPRLTLPFMQTLRALCLQVMPAAPNLTVPTLVVVPEQDKICDPKAMHRFYQAIPTAVPKKVLSLPHHYHNVLMEEETEPVRQAMLAWGLSGA
jgi:4,5:9,10-diseco-3-hydroxy-5,9,17-trioxoandrosta-1(10),2-diene-4-oate hydrolase